VSAGGIPIQPAGGRRIWTDVGTTPGGGGPSPTGSSPAQSLGVWGHLLLVRKIGEGSYGEVFHAHDTWLDHAVALKLFKPEVESRTPGQDLLHEARKLARVRHPNVVTVHGADRHNGRVGFWMDFIDGETLSVRVGRGRMSALEATSVGVEVCRALAAVHRANIIHRDVKAQNVMRAHDGGRIILMDFGAGEFMGNALDARAQGTPLYLAPEIFRGDGASPRSDIYAAGVLLYHLVTGRFPVEGGSPRAVAEAHERGVRRRLRDERPDLPEGFIALVERAIDPEPARRFATAGELEAKLSREEKPPPPDPQTLLNVVRLLTSIGAVTIALTGVLGFIATRFFDVTLRVDRSFALSAADTFSVGASALLPFLAMWLVGAVVIGVLAGVLLVLGYPLATLSTRFRVFSSKWDPSTTAAFIVLSGVVVWFSLNWVFYSDYFTTVLKLADDIAAPIDVSILGSTHRATHTSHHFLSAYSAMLLGLIVWRWFPHLEHRSAPSSAIRLWKWGAIAVAFAFIAWAVVPRRLVWERFPVIEFENRSGVVIGSTGNELLVFTSNESGRPRRRLGSNVEGLRRTGETRFLFDTTPAK
jgi:serine/threonine-protein kinase